MARNAAEFTTKRNSKLDSFLKLHLSQNVYERIIAYEPCIVDHRKEKKAFKYVVLSDERIYLTENPPKTIREEDGVQLGEVTSIELVNEFPEFLNGEERDNCQHICVKYKGKHVKKASKKSADKQGNGVEEGSSSDGSSPVPELILTEPNGSTLEPSSRSSSMRSLRLNRSLDESDLRSLRDLSVDSDSDSEDRLSWSMPSGDLESMSMHSLESLSLGSGEMMAADKGKGKIKGVDTCRPLPQRPPVNKGQQQRSVDKKDSFSSQIALTLVNREANSPSVTSLSTKSQYRNLPSPETPDTDKSKSKPFQFPSSEKEYSKKDQQSHLSLVRHKSLDADVPRKNRNVSNKENQSLEDFLVDYDSKKEEELHLYVISLSSPLLMHLRSSWNNYVIKSTIMLDPKMVERLKPTSGSAKGPTRTQLERNFVQLKQEILNSGDSMENLFGLVQELLTAGEKYFVLKKLFWKQPDLFTFILQQLQRYLPKSAINVHTEKGKHHRADELELAILLIDTLGLMFHETEILNGRLTILKANSGKAALDLLVVLTCHPEIPQRWRPPRTKTQSLLLETDTDSWETYADAEVSKLVQELTNASTVVLFELILIAHQSNWGNDEGKFFNICWIVRVLETMQSTLLEYVKRVLAQAMKLLMPSRHETLTPSDAVLLFQQFFVLQTLLEYSPQVSAHVRNNYNEEFRYYVQSPHIVKKLPKHYPITLQTLRIIDEVLSLVLQKPAALLAKKLKKK